MGLEVFICYLFFVFAFFLGGSLSLSSSSVIELMVAVIDE